MRRHQVCLRPACVEDALFLVELWADALRRCDVQEQVAHVEVLVKESTANPEQRLLVAEVDGVPAGAVLLRVSTVTPLNPEPVVQAFSPHVTPTHRRQGVGRALLEAAVAYAEELGVPLVATAAASASRDANRFMARLGLSPQATLRLAGTHAVRAKIEAQRPPQERDERSRAQVLAARRSLRRRRALRED